MSNFVNRRSILLTGLVGLLLTSSPVFAFSTSKAQKLIEGVVGDINSIINSGKSEASMLQDFEGIFSKYADGARIGQLVLGPASRAATAAQRKNFADAFQTYIARKYGRRFREFIGGRIEVTGAKAIKSFYEVTTVALLSGEAPFEIQFVVADKNGRFIDMKIEGISLIKAERLEIGSMLDKRRGNIDQLIADLIGIG
ncbi:MAG: MlaC/ttg2D family ABC transporter substrate-binding protein [Paracoccaceae bacterium]